MQRLLRSHVFMPLQFMKSERMMLNWHQNLSNASGQWRRRGWSRTYMDAQSKGRMVIWYKWLLVIYIAIWVCTTLLVNNIPSFFRHVITSSTLDNMNSPSKIQSVRRKRRGTTNPQFLSASKTSSTYNINRQPKLDVIMHKSTLCDGT